MVMQDVEQHSEVVFKLVYAQSLSSCWCGRPPSPRPCRMHGSRKGSLYAYANASKGRGAGAFGVHGHREQGPAGGRSARGDAERCAPIIFPHAFRMLMHN